MCYINRNMFSLNIPAPEETHFCQLIFEWRFAHKTGVFKAIFQRTELDMQPPNDQCPANDTNMNDDEDSKTTTDAIATANAAAATAFICRQRQHDPDNETRQQRCTDSLQTMAHGMDFSQIELSYRAEGNANLVLALPQFRKVLRLPKSSIVKAEEEGLAGNRRLLVEDCCVLPKQNLSISDAQKSQQSRESLDHPKETCAHRLASNGDLTMADYMGYIDVIRRLLGSEFIFAAELIKIPNEQQRKFINETIRPFRPAQRLDKEFCGQFGLLLPDATLLPEADILLSNLQTTTTTEEVRSSGDTYAIEIKPKQGWWLPYDANDLLRMQPTMCPTTMATLTTETAATLAAVATMATTIRTATTATAATTCFRSATTTRCRYCAMQFLKLKTRKIQQRNAYCPLALFSGQPPSMLAALSALFECPQNNLRIFRNGDLIYGDHSSTISCEELKRNVFQGDMLQIVQHLLIECLLRDFDGGSEKEAIVVKAVAGQPHSSGTPTTSHSKLETLETCSVIELKEKSLQRPLNEKTEVEQTPTQHQVKKLKLDQTPMTVSAEKEAETQITEVELLCLPKNCVLQKVLHLQLLAKRNFQQMSRNKFANNTTTRSYSTLASLLALGDRFDTAEQLEPAQQYLLGATALDCSLMIAFQQIVADERLPKHAHVVEVQNKAFLVKVTVLDLDPKPDSHFNKYVRQSREAYAAFEEALPSE